MKKIVELISQLETTLGLLSKEMETLRYSAEDLRYEQGVARAHAYKEVADLLEKEDGRSTEELIGLLRYKAFATALSSEILRKNK
jgi:hypothetical protein